jgi:hypothetical protein
VGHEGSDRTGHVVLTWVQDAVSADLLRSDAVPSANVPCCKASACPGLGCGRVLRYVWSYATAAVLSLTAGAARLTDSIRPRQIENMSGIAICSR